MIPKKLHYIWLGGKPLPKIAEKCIASWKKCCPDYEIIRWDESNLDLNKYQYAIDAYEAKKYAFVSDVFRFDILYREGGIYLDTDVEIVKPIDELLNEKAFTGFETSDTIAPGLIFGSENGNSILNDILKIYEKKDYEDSQVNKETVCTIFTNYLISKNLLLNNKKQNLEKITVYPSECFCPINVVTGKKKITKNTYTIHWYAASWYSPKQKMKHKIKVFLNIVTFGLFGKIVKCKLRRNT